MAKGNGRLRAGAAVTLANVGEPFQGKYVLTSTRHLFSEEAGYTTAFTVSGRSDPSLLRSHRWRAGRRAARGTGCSRRSSTTSRTRSGSGRVRLTLPWLDGKYTSGWARVVQAGAGAGGGQLLLPEVGDEVLVGFSDGDLDSAYVLGGLHNGRDPLPKLGAEPVDDASGEVVVRALVSRTGHRLELAETASGPDGVLLSTGDGGCALRLDAKGRLVEVISSGKVRITAKEGLSVDAGAGPLESTGRQVTLRSQGDVAIEGSGTVGLAAAQRVKVAGSGSAEVTAGGSVTVRGGIVRIN